MENSNNCYKFAPTNNKNNKTMKKSHFEELFDEAMAAITEAKEAAPTKNTREKLSEVLDILNNLTY